jgi:predicted RNA-binding Zn-ribbon protein involved in translation (DUF1610 family)
MTWPSLVNRTATCPSCGASVAALAIHEPHRRVHGSRDRIYESVTWFDCPKCGAEWSLRNEASPAPGQAA